MIEWQHKMTEKYIPQLTALAPHSGAYMNEVSLRYSHLMKVELVSVLMEE